MVCWQLAGSVGGDVWPLGGDDETAETAGWRRQTAETVVRRAETTVVVSETTVCVAETPKLRRRQFVCADDTVYQQKRWAQSFRGFSDFLVVLGLWRMGFLPKCVSSTCIHEKNTLKKPKQQQKALVGLDLVSFQKEKHENKENCIKKLMRMIHAGSHRACQNVYEMLVC